MADMMAKEMVNNTSIGWQPEFEYQGQMLTMETAKEISGKRTEDGHPFSTEKLDWTGSVDYKGP
ncbi:hypothetical protein MAR_036922 [Mya arenaria]|uniref:Uncharacterized protein n=1 Tax=Mya arenaria TaxID=6604 RepID=A0ABY7FM15_MYAAR|nr:hypothetical protein MAR_036922 [Mya arenaria]